jgi:hypothetical protein
VAAANVRDVNDSMVSKDTAYSTCAPPNIDMRR